VVANALTINNNESLIDRSLVVKISRMLEFEWEVVVVVHHSYLEANQYIDALS